MSYWEERRFIVTGGAGFLGSFVVEKLQERGAAEVIVPRSSNYDLRDLSAIRRLLDDVISSPNARTPALDGSNVVVIHLAARVGGIGANRHHPAEFFYDNLLMGTQLLHESWKSGVEKFVAIGTACSYPKDAPVPVKEDSLWLGYPEETNAPYGLAKKMMLVQAQAYRQQYGFAPIYLIPVNLYGPKDNFDLESSHVIPALIRKFLEASENGGSEPENSDATVTVWGTGNPTRGFLYVEDAAEGILQATERYDGGDPVNLASEMEISIRELVQLIASLTGFKGEVLWDRDKPDGQPRRSLDSSMAARLFKFKAKTSFQDGLHRTIDWYKAQSEAVKGGAAASG